MHQLEKLPQFSSTKALMDASFTERANLPLFSANDTLTPNEAEVGPNKNIEFTNIILRFEYLYKTACVA